MNLAAQEIIWIIAINNEKVRNLETFIKKYCEFEIVPGDLVYPWTPYRINQERMMIPQDENDFLHKLYSFSKLIDKLIANEMIHFATKLVGLNELLPIFRKGGQPFQRAWELLKNKQGLIIYPTPQLKEFISDGFITKEEKRYIEERHQRIKSEFLTMIIAVTAIIALIATVVAWIFFESTKVEENMFLNQEFAYHSAIAQRKILYSESIIEVRAKAIMWLDEYRKERNITGKKNLALKWSQINEEIKVNNSTALIYSSQLYNSVINFDDLFREISSKLINGTMPDSLYNPKRKELGQRFDILIKSIRENTLDDPSYIKNISDQGDDAKSIIEF